MLGSLAEVLCSGSEVEGEVRVQNADGSVEVQPNEEPWDGSSSATSSSDVSTLIFQPLAKHLKFSLAW